MTDNRTAKQERVSAERAREIVALRDIMPAGQRAELLAFIEQAEGDRELMKRVKATLCTPSMHGDFEDYAPDYEDCLTIARELEGRSDV